MGKLNHTLFYIESNGYANLSVKKVLQLHAQFKQGG